MKALCKKCGKVTEFEEKKLITKAGDNGFCQITSYICKECGFAPLFRPKEEENDESTSNS